MPTTYLLGKLEGTDTDISGVSESETKVSESEVLDPIPDSELAGAKVPGAEASPQGVRY